MYRRNAAFIVTFCILILIPLPASSQPTESLPSIPLSQQLTDLRERLPKLIAQAQKEAIEAKRATAAREALTPADGPSQPSPIVVAQEDSRPVGGWVDTIAQSVLALVGLILTALVGIVVPKAVSAFERYVGMKFDDKQLEAIYNSANTAKGILETKIDQGVLKLADLSENHPIVRDETRVAISRVPDAVAHHKVTDDQMAKIIVSRVETGPKSEPVVLNLQVPPVPESIS